MFLHTLLHEDMVRQPH